MLPDDRLAALEIVGGIRGTDPTPTAERGRVPCDCLAASAIVVGHIKFYMAWLPTVIISIEEKPRRHRTGSSVCK